MREVTIYVFIIVLIGAGAMQTAAEPVLDLERRSSTLWNAVSTVAVTGDYAYCSMPFGLQVYDISDRSQPTLINHLYEVDNGGNMDIDGDVLVVTQGRDGVYIFDITDRVNPSLMTVLETPYWVNVARKFGDTLYVGTAGSGLTVFDISDLAQPIQVADKSYPNNVKDVDVNGAFVYVGTGYHGAMVYELSGTPYIYHRSTFDPIGNIESVRYRNGYLYAAASGYGLSVLDVSDPANPVEVGRYDHEEQCREVLLFDHFAIYDYDNGFFLLDISNPTNPVNVNHGLPIVGAAGLDYEAGFLYVPTGYRWSDPEALYIVDMTDPYSPVIAGQKEYSSKLTDLDVAGNYAYVLGEEAGVYIVDIQDGYNPEVVGYYPYTDSGDLEDIEVIGFAMIIAGWDGLQIIDVTDPAVPSLLAELFTDQIIWALESKGTLLFVATRTEGMIIVDMVDPTAPQVIGSFGPPVEYENGPRALAVQNDLALVPYGFLGVYVVDISDPANPVELGMHPVNYEIWSVALNGSRAFLSHNNRHLEMLDISDPTNPVLTGYDPGSNNADHLVTLGDYVFLADYQLMIYDTYDAQYPIAIFDDYLLGREQDLVIRDSMMYRASFFGFSVYQVSLPEVQPGDIDGDGAVSIADAVSLVNYIFMSGPGPASVRVGDCNCDGSANIADAVYLIDYIFGDGPPPVTDCCP